MEITAHRARTISSDAEALEAVMRIWADSGFVDASDQHFVFFDGRGADDDRAVRAELLILLERLGL